MPTTIALEDRQSFAKDPALRVKVEAAEVKVAWDMLAAPAITGTGLQEQRLALADAIIHTSDYAVEQFSWLIVIQAAFTSVDDINDSQITAQIASHFDQVAQAIMPSGGP